MADPTTPPLSLSEAITALLDDYKLEEFVDYYRDEAKYDTAHAGLAEEHPTVIRFKQVCATLRAAQMRTEVPTP